MMDFHSKKANVVVALIGCVFILMLIYSSHHTNRIEREFLRGYLYLDFEVDQLNYAISNGSEIDQVHHLTIISEKVATAAEYLMTHKPLNKADDHDALLKLLSSIQKYTWDTIGAYSTMEISQNEAKTVVEDLTDISMIISDIDVGSNDISHIIEEELKKIDMNNDILQQYYQYGK